MSKIGVDVTSDVFVGDASGEFSQEIRRDTDVTKVSDF